jgi:hypothetical protein
MPSALFAGHAVAAAMEHAHANGGVGMSPCPGSIDARDCGDTFFVQKMFPVRSGSVTMAQVQPSGSAGAEAGKPQGVCINRAPLIASRTHK